MIVGKSGNAGSDRNDCKRNDFLNCGETVSTLPKNTIRLRQEKKMQQQFRTSFYDNSFYREQK
ncbi:MAG: hypothetical protein LBP87_06830 [Planctomycetaceae bacterium]|nr:hypothetical protein [Planctomycetaceae bacterium]